MEFLGTIIGLAFFAVFFLLIAKNIGLMKALSNEKKQFKIMLANPCDATVRDYLDAYAKTTTGFAHIQNSNRGGEHRNDQLRQAQGWEVLRENESISEDLKMQMRNAFIAEGVPVK